MSSQVRKVMQIKKKQKKRQGGIIKNAYPLNIDKPRGYQLNSADNVKELESHADLYSFRSETKMNNIPN